MIASSRHINQKGLTKVERNVRDAYLFHDAKKIARRVEMYQDAENRGLRQSIITRRRREMLLACEDLIDTANQRLSDRDLRDCAGSEAVQVRDAALGATADVVVMKRHGRPLGRPPV